MRCMSIGNMDYLRKSANLFCFVFYVLVAQEENKQPSPVLVRPPVKGKEKTKENLGSPFPPAHTEGRETLPSDCGRRAFERWHQTNFRHSEPHTQNTKARLKRQESLIPKRRQLFTLRQNSTRGIPTSPLRLQRTCRTFLLTSVFSHHIPLLNCHSPSTVRERLVLLSDSELSQRASLIFWQRRSMAMWQLKGTRPSSQSSRKSATTSLDQPCPMTSMARHSLLCSYTSEPKEVSLAEQELIHSGLTGQSCLHMSPKSGY